MNKYIKFEKMTREDKRKQPRYKLSEKYIGKVKVKVNPLKRWYCRSYKTILIDFSRNGLKLRTHNVLNINDKVTITFGNGATVSGSVRNIKKLKVDGNPHFIYGLYLHDTLSISLIRWLGVDNIECSTVADGNTCTCRQICRYGLEANTRT